MQLLFVKYQTLSVLMFCAIARLCLYLQPAVQLFQGAHVMIYRSVATCLIQYTFLSLCQLFSRENGQNTKILEVRHFCMIQKWPPTVTTRAKH